MQNVNNNIEDCIDCMSCMKGCVLLDDFTQSPKSLLTSFQNINPDPDISFSCANCNYCFTVCPEDISFQDIFTNSKIEHAKDDKVLNSFGYKAVLFHQKTSFSKLFTSKTKFTTGEHRNIAFMPGCALSSYSPDLVQKIYKHLKDMLPGINIIQQCCGQPTKTVGDNKRFNTYYKKLENDIDYMNVDVIVTACENCNIILKENSPDIKAITLYEILDQYGIPKEKEDAYGFIESIALHDPCPTRYQSELHESVRNLLSLMGIDFKEFKHNRRKTECCGSGGMLELTNPELASKQMKSRANQTECENIITYCQSCTESMTKGGKNGIHILDLLFSDKIEHDFKQKQFGTVSKWYHRYKSKRMIDKIKEEK